MNSMISRTGLWTILCGGMLFPACGTVCAEPPADVPQSLGVAPAEFVLVSSRGRQNLLVSAGYADRTEADVTRQASYRSLDPRVATVTESGIVLPVGNGTTEIVAQWGSFGARARVTVSDFSAPLPIDFRTEVIGALSRGGCNQGACHGSPHGKQGFQLSLRGGDPARDFHWLTHDMFGRRVNPGEPEASLILLKSSGRVAHQGGVRFRRDEPAYRLLGRWVAEGARDSLAARRLRLHELELLPDHRELHRTNRQQQIVVRAHFDDGTIRDVTDLAVFTSADENRAEVTREGLVTFEKTAEAAILVRYLGIIRTVRLAYIDRDPEFVAKIRPGANDIDRHVFAKHRKLQLRSAERCSDAVFLRRVTLDLTGSIPTPKQARDFLDADDPDKRSKLIDRLLDSEAYAYFWALKWADVMRGNRQTISERGVHNFHRYLVRQFASDRPFDQFATEITTSRGNTIHESAANFYRVSRTPSETAESFSQLFLGVRIQCAKCHNHPYESITQKDYYGLAAYFARVRLKGQRFGIDDLTVYLARDGEVKFPETNEVISPAAFGEPAGKLSQGDDRRTRLAAWLTKPNNRYFARSTVNRIWFHLLARGIVEPIDDFRDSNPPSNSELLEGLADDFIKHGYRFKPLIRSILNSNVYQLSAELKGGQSPQAAGETGYFTRAEIKMFSAEQILDAISSALGIPEPFPSYPLGTKAIELAEGGVDHKFLEAFTKPIRDVACDCARDTEPSLNQVVHLLNNPRLLDKIDSPESRLGHWLAEGRPAGTIVESLYLATLSRRPSAQEHRLALDYIKTADKPSAAFRDLQHVLINSNEFLLRH